MDIYRDNNTECSKLLTYCKIWVEIFIWIGENIKNKSIFYTPVDKVYAGQITPEMSRK